jgi:hypothetical protein
MSLNFQNISTLSLQQQSRFFQAGFNYVNIKNISIAGFLTDLTNSFGITGIWTGISQTQIGAVDYQPLMINNVNFGSGRILSVSYSDGNDVRLKTYTANIEVLDSGNLFNFTGTYYNGVNLQNAQYLQQFDENWDFNKKPNGGYTYSHNASITFTTGVGNLNAIEAAKTLAKTLFTGANIGFAFYSGQTNKQGKRFFTESYNIIDKSCSFSESFDFDVNRGPYSSTRNHSVSIDEFGIVSANERGEIRGIENPNYQKALAALNGELTGSYYRCSGVAFSYFPTGAVLVSSPLSQSRSFDLFNNLLSYDVAYNNAPNNLETYFWDYTQEVSRNAGIGVVTENGTLLGRQSNPTLAFDAAKAGFVTVKTGIQTRATSLFASSFGAATNFLQSKNENYSPFNGTLSYSYQYSNDPALIANAGIRRKEVSISTNQTVYNFNKLNIFNYNQIAQDDKQSTVGTATINVSMQGDKSVALFQYLNAALTDINLNAPIGNERYVGDVNYSYNPNEGTVDASATWVYNRGANRTTYPQ